MKSTDPKPRPPPPVCKAARGPCAPVVRVYVGVFDTSDRGRTSVTGTAAALDPDVSNAQGPCMTRGLSARPAAVSGSWEANTSQALPRSGRGGADRSLHMLSLCFDSLQSLDETGWWLSPRKRNLSHVLSFPLAQQKERHSTHLVPAGVEVTVRVTVRWGWG
jgi:hypothetical protein